MESKYELFPNIDCPFCGQSLISKPKPGENASAGSIVKQIVEQFGADILLQKNRFLSVFVDYAPKMRKEKKMLSIALDENIATLFVNCETSDRELHVKKAQRALDMILAESAIHFVVETFAYAFDWDIEIEAPVSEVSTPVKESVGFPENYKESSQHNLNNASENTSLKVEGILIVPSMYGFDAELLTQDESGNPVKIGSFHQTDESGQLNETTAYELLKSCKDYVQGNLSDVVLFLPSSFSFKQRKNIKLSCEKLSIQISHIAKICGSIIEAQCNGKNEKVIIIYVGNNLIDTYIDVSLYEISDAIAEEIGTECTSLSNDRIISKEDRLSKILDMLNKATLESGWSKNKINHIYICGDCVILPELEAKLVREPCCKVTKVSLDVIPHGYPHLKSTKLYPVLLIEALSNSIGLETAGGVATKIIPKSKTIPTKETLVFSTAVDNQSAVDIAMLCGENAMAKDNECIGRFRFDGILPAKAGVPQIEITIEIDSSENIKVSGKDISISDRPRDLGVYNL